jgi:drug/metabolite transporter (DMT)-like permease
MTNRVEQGLAHASLVLCQFLFTGWHILSKIALNKGANPVIFALYKQIISSILMFILVLVKGIKISIERKDWLVFVFIGLCIFININGTMFALANISPTRYALFQPTIPCIAALISVLRGLEKPNGGKAVGILLAVGGALTIVAWPKPGGSTSTQDEKNITLGTIIVITQCVAMASVLVFQKPLLSKYDPPLVTFTYYSCGMCFTVIFAACWSYRLTAESLVFNYDWTPVYGLLYTCFFSSLFAYNAYAWAGKRLLPSVTTLYCTLQPPITAVVSWLVFNDIITVPEYIGGILVLMGLFVTVQFGYIATHDDRDNDHDANEHNDTKVAKNGDYHLLEETANHDG